MHFVTMEIQDKIKIGLTDEAQRYVLDLDRAYKELGDGGPWPSSLLEGIEQGEPFIDSVSRLRDAVFMQRDSESYFYPMEEVRLLAPIPRPHKNIFCVGKNYRDHVLEMGNEGDIPEHIMIFTKAPTSVIGPGAFIDSHEALTAQLDYEGELAIVIGKHGKGISIENALDHVFGYTIVNDVTARICKSSISNFSWGKVWIGTCPMGPAIVHKSFIDDPQSLIVETKVNEEVRQHASTELMMFSIPEIISTLSKGMTLEPGDIIATGTPSGVGKGFVPPRFLKKGDVVEVSVEKVGSLRNVVV